MHEMSLAGGILRVVEQAQAREGFKRVSRLALEAGALSGVEVSALRFALEAMSPGTLLDGATIDITQPPAAAWCMACAQAVTIQSRLDDCPLCGSAQIQPTGGHELKVLELIVHDDLPGDAAGDAAGDTAGATPQGSPASTGQAV
ncbi:MAG: hydrogenase maturation nickel metallochaperone HypA [Burkholderiales bacterium]|nr:hydrogenase maturation nickel metallochaperone HypA [Burkholderiales bacterium]